MESTLVKTWRSKAVAEVGGDLPEKRGRKGGRACCSKGCTRFCRYWISARRANFVVGYEFRREKSIWEKSARDGRCLLG